MKNATMSEVRTALLKGGVMVRDGLDYKVDVPDYSCLRLTNSTAKRLFKKGELQCHHSGRASYWTLWPHVAERMGKETK